MSDEDVTEHAAERRSTPGFFYRRVVLSWILIFGFSSAVFGRTGSVWSQRRYFFGEKQNQVLNYSVLLLSQFLIRSQTT